MNEISETKTPKAGEWWVSDRGVIAYVVGLTIDGQPEWQQKGSRRILFDEMKYFLECYHHAPGCTGFDWLPVADALAREFCAENPKYCVMCGVVFGVGSVAPVQHPTLDPDDVPLHPVPGKVVATGTVKLTPVQPDDWVEFDPAHITCPRVSVDWLTLRLGESEWGPALLAWSNATWAAQRENWKIRCYRRDLPMRPDDTAAIIAEHTTQVRELTQRIGDLVQQVNQRDAVIERIKTALRADFI